MAIPVVDVGDDAIVIDDGEHALRRLQVKSASCKPVEAVKSNEREEFKASFTLKRKQLGDPGGVDLYYMLVAWVWGRWCFILISRQALSDRYARAVAASRCKREAKSKDVTIEITYSRTRDTSAEGVSVWGDSLDEYLDRWVDWPELPTGRAWR